MVIFLSILIGIITILLLITFHEFAHFVIAKLSGAYVYEFSVGMGPKIFQWGKKETRYTIRLLPLGGYVSIASEIVDPPKGREEEVVDESRLMENIHRGKKALFISGGALMNLFLAFILLIFAYGLYPYKQDLSLPPTYATSGPVYDKITDYNKKHPDAPIASNAIITKIDAIGTNNIVSSWDPFGSPSKWSENYNSLSSWIKSDLDNIDSPSLSIYFNKDSNPQIENLKPTGSKGSYFVGVTASNRHLSTGQVFGDGIVDTFKNSYSILQALGKLVTFHWSNISGPVGIVKSANVFLNPNASSLVNASTYFRWAALLSANLFLLNMIPIPPLDGYKFLENAVEAISRKKISSKYKIVVSIIGGVLFLLVFVAVTIKDILF